MMSHMEHRVLYVIFDMLRARVTGFPRCTHLRPSIKMRWSSAGFPASAVEDDREVRGNKVSSTSDTTPSPDRPTRVCDPHETPTSMNPKLHPQLTILPIEEVLRVPQSAWS